MRPPLGGRKERGEEMVIQKGLLVAAGMAFAGIVVYKIAKKKGPDVLKNVGKIRDDVLHVISGMKGSFREGYVEGAL